MTLFELVGGTVYLLTIIAAVQMVREIRRVRSAERIGRPGPESAPPAPVVWPCSRCGGDGREPEA